MTSPNLPPKAPFFMLNVAYPNTLNNRIPLAPAHLVLEGNIEVNRVARGCTTYRALEEPIPVPTEYSARLAYITVILEEDTL